MKDKAWDIIITMIITFIVTFFINGTVSFFTAENGTIQIGNLIEYDSNTFIVPVDIRNYSDSDFEKINIYIPLAISESDIKSSSPLNIIKVKNNINTQVGSSFVIEKIPEEQKVQLLFKLNKSINVNEISIMNDNNTEVEYTNSSKSPLKKSLPSLIIMCLYYTLAIGIYSYYSLRKIHQNTITLQETKQQIQMLQDEVIKIKDESAQERKELVESAKNSLKRTNKYLISKMSDLNKELRFWRDTVRKLMYESRNERINSELIIKTVTNVLKTYKTNRGESDIIDEIESIVSEFENFDR